MADSEGKIELLVLEMLFDDVWELVKFVSLWASFMWPFCNYDFSLILLDWRSSFVVFWGAFWASFFCTSCTFFRFSSCKLGSYQKS